MPLIATIARARKTYTEVEVVGLVTCPNCQVEMRRVSTKPVAGALELREAAYQCPRCGAETKRWVKI